MARPWKHPDSGIYYLRVRVPRDVTALTGRAFEKVSLRTKDPQAARFAHAQRLAETQLRWVELRKGEQVLTSRQVEALAGEVYRKVRDRLPPDDRSWTVRHPYAFVTFSYGLALGEEGHSLPPGRTDDRPVWERVEELVGSDVDDVLAGHGLRVQAHSRQALAVAAARATFQALMQTMKECEGDWRPDPDADRFPAPYTPASEGGAALSLDALWAVASVGLADSTQRRWKPILRRLSAASGKVDFARIATSDIERWRDASLLEGRVSPRTFARNDLAAVKTVLQAAVEEKLLPANVAKDVRVRRARKTKAADMRGFHDDEAATILTATTIPPTKRMSAHFAAARRWVPWICAYTGARVNEITQCRACDIRRIDGVWCIWITPEAGTTKGDFARDVPLHEHLLAQGLIEFVQGKSGKTRLFASAKGPGAPGIMGGKLAGWVRELGINDPLVWPNHGWRHRFRTEAKPLMQEQFLDAILGHAPKTQGRKYGAFPPRQLGPLIALVPRIVV